MLLMHIQLYVNTYLLIDYTVVKMSYDVIYIVVLYAVTYQYQPMYVVMLRNIYDNDIYIYCWY